MNRRMAFAALAALAFAPAWGHGEKPDGHAAPVVQEQQPWGIAGDAGAVTRTIEIRMTDDMRFSPDRIAVREGETVRFVVRNRGKLLHEMVIGTREALDRHAELMMKHPGMEHDEPHMVHVAAGRRGEMVWNFNRPGTFQFACLIAGHYQAGMTGTLVVAPAARQGKQP